MLTSQSEGGGLNPGTKAETAAALALPVKPGHSVIPVGPRAFPAAAPVPDLRASESVSK